MDGGQVAHQKNHLMFFSKGELEQSQEQRYSALEGNGGVFGLQCLAPVPL
jgi:hypothetical protein